MKTTARATAQAAKATGRLLKQPLLNRKRPELQGQRTEIGAFGWGYEYNRRWTQIHADESDAI
jgi:hypothetical protein